MLRDVTRLSGYAIEALDGELGHVADFYFDDESWVIRYLVVETGTWLSNRKVLISPMSAGEPNWSSGKLPVQLTCGQVGASPNIDTAKPVSRQYEQDFNGYYAYPNYWGSAGLWGVQYYPWSLHSSVGNESVLSVHPAGQGERQRMAHIAAKRADNDPHLRSCNAVTGYHIHAQDGDIGHVQGMLIDEQSWAIRYLVINTSNWWLGHEVLVAPEWITDVSWSTRKVAIDLTRQAIKDSPHWDPAQPPDRQHETEMYRHYGRRGHWDADSPEAAQMIAPRTQ